MNAEEKRLEEDRLRTAYWKRWGPYLSERQWGTVREDYSSHGTAWDYFPHDHARSRAYRWGEDGIAGISDNHQKLCFALALWNGEDPILKERLFGLTGPEGNHGEDVKEYYFYLDSTPTHSYMKSLYKYPQKAYPYTQLVEENRNRGPREGEYELIDTGVFDENRFFDVFVEYAKASPEDILIRISAANRGPEEKTLHVLPHFWYRNTWSWGNGEAKPSLCSGTAKAGWRVIEAEHPSFGKRRLFAEGSPELLFTENETNFQKLFGVANPSPYVKDGVNDSVVNGMKSAVNPKREGTKCALHYQMKIKPEETTVIRLRFTDSAAEARPFEDFNAIFELRKKEADEFYKNLIPEKLTEDCKQIERQALAGMLWSKQYYHYVVEQWMEGDSVGPPPPRERRNGRNREWMHLYNEDILSMPDKWEYPWFAAWDLAFHCVPLAIVDPEFAKRQLVLLTREWYMHPNGQIPAYEWAFSDVNPPVHAWAAWRVYKIEKKMYGRADHLFLERVFQKLLLNFTWWVNRKDSEGKNIFQGGFLGLDNIGVFDRSKPLPTGGHIEQSDGTSWMAMYCLNMLKIALELALVNPSYEDIASKFLEHFFYIAHAMNNMGDEHIRLWNEEDGFFYDVLHLHHEENIPLKVRSMVGLIPLFAVETLDPEILEALPGFKKRMEWFLGNRPILCSMVSCMWTLGVAKRKIMAIVSRDKLAKILKVMLDEKEFLSPYGLRAVSKIHKGKPYVLQADGQEYRVDYEPAESSVPLFGGNSNWRGPIWFPVNYLIIEALQKFYYYYGDDFKVECPTGSGKLMNLWEVATELSHRLIEIFVKDRKGRRPVFDGQEKFQTDPHWKDLPLFFEYFHGDTGAGLGASHQTGWTGLAAKLLHQCGEYCGRKKPPQLVKKELQAAYK